MHNDRYLRVKNSNKNRSEFLTLSPCLEIWCFLSIFGRFRVIPASFSSAVDGLKYFFYETTILTREFGVPVTADVSLEVTKR